MDITEREKALILIGYMQGYEGGHHDTVESQYTDAEDSARDWLADAIADSGLSYLFEALIANHKGKCTHCDDTAETTDNYGKPSCFPCAYDSAN